MDEVGREEHEEFKQRMEDEHKRINRRLQELETVTKQITDLALSVQKLATSIENMVQAQNRQEERLSELESRETNYNMHDYSTDWWSSWVAVKECRNYVGGDI